jgi:hypothetical protein
MNKTINYLRIISIFFVFALLAGPGAAMAQTPPVTCSSADLGDVVIGTTGTVTVTAENTGEGLLYFDFSLPAESNPCGFVATGCHLVRVPAGESSDIIIDWTPSVPGECAADLQILNYRTVIAHITLTGNAITEVAKKELPNVSGLVNSFEERVKNGDIVGKGWGRSADRHLNAFRKMLVKAGMLMDQGYAKKACYQLRATLKLTRFLISGSAVGELRQEINEVLASLKKDAIGSATVAQEQMPEMELLLSSFNEWVAGGDIEGKGYAKYASRNLEAFSNMLVKANDLVERGHSKRAYVQLMEARKMSGHLIRGDAVDDLKELISEVLNSLRA